MGKYVGDLLFGGFWIVLLVIFLRDHQQANDLVGGLAGTYTTSVSQLSNLGA